MIPLINVFSTNRLKLLKTITQPIYYSKPSEILYSLFFEICPQNNKSITCIFSVLNLETKLLFRFIILGFPATKFITAQNKYNDNQQVNNFMFQRDGRFASLRNFNPPPNIYQPYNSFAKPQKQIKTGSLRGPSESLNIFGTFGAVKRFHNHNNQIPGPGTYRNTQQPNDPSILKTKYRKRAQSELQPSASAALVNTQVLATNQKNIFIGKPGQHVNKHEEIHQQQQIKPGYSFPKSRYLQREMFRKLEEQTQIIFQQCLGPQEFQPVKKIKQHNRRRKFQMLEMILKRQIPKPNAMSLQLKRKHQQKPSPGPGAYQVHLKSRQNLISNTAFKSKAQKISVETKDQKADLRGPGAYQIPQPRKSQGHCFTRSERKTSLVSNKELPVQFYEKEILGKKSYNKPSVNFQAPFGSGTNRFSQVAKGLVQQQKTKLSKNKSRSSTRYMDSQLSHVDQVKQIQNIDILSNFYKNT